MDSFEDTVRNLLLPLCECLYLSPQSNSSTIKVAKNIKVVCISLEIWGLVKFCKKIFKHYSTENYLEKVFIIYMLGTERNKILSI